MNNIKFGIVTVNYNSSGYTKNMLDSLVGNDRYIKKIIIVDNSSDESERALLKEIVADFNSSIEVFLIFSDINLGYFRGLNLGLSKLDIESLDGVIVCNNDLFFKEGFLDKLSSKKIDEKTYAICPSVKTIDNIYQNPSMVNKPSFFRMFFYDLYYSNYILGGMILKIWRYLGLGADSRFIKDEQEKEIFIGIGAIYFLTKNYFIINKELPNDTFLYGEEAFLAKQIYDTGGVKIYCPDLEVIHFESISTNKLPSVDKYNFNKIAYEKYRSFFKQKS